MKRMFSPLSVNQNHSEPTDCNLHTIWVSSTYCYTLIFLYMEIQKRREIGDDIARRCQREPCTSEARKKHKVWLKELKQLCTKKRHSSTKSFHEIPNSISPETLTVTHVGEKKLGHQSWHEKRQTDYKKKKKAGGGQGACDLSARNDKFKSVKKKIQILQHPWDMQRNYIVSNAGKERADCWRNQMYTIA